MRGKEIKKQLTSSFPLEIKDASKNTFGIEVTSFH